MPPAWPLFHQPERRLRAGTDRVPDAVGQLGGDLGDEDVQVVLVIHLKDLGYQARADRIGLAGVAVDLNPHREPPSPRRSRVSWSRAVPGVEHAPGSRGKAAGATLDPYDDTLRRACRGASRRRASGADQA